MHCGTSGGLTKLRKLLAMRIVSKAHMRKILVKRKTRSGFGDGGR